ncbi:MAG: isoaspartyl peptidase/L-asparaginase [Planctomycetota bacterium]
MQHTDRRRFLIGAGLTLAGISASRASARQQDEAEGDRHRGPAAIASGNGLRTAELARRRIVDEGADPAVAIVEGVGIVEADPSDRTVGLGGLPDERGIVTLDASVMHGPLHKAGSVAALENVVHAAAVALKVLQTTDHVMLVGPGALEFARRHGFPEQDLLTKDARNAWLRWKSNLNPNDDWLDDDQRDWSPDGKSLASAPIKDKPAPQTTGTIHCSAVTPGGDLAGCTTTSGLSYKLHGRVGDSPIIGAGCYTDNEVGSAGATGRGESAIQSCAAFAVVQEMSAGLPPTEACLAVLRRVSARSVKQRRLRRDDGAPNFNLTLYAVRKDGAYGSACIHEGGSFAAADSNGAAVRRSAFLYPRR